MRPFVVLSLLACSLFSTPVFAAWDIFQSYVIIDAGSGNQFLAGGYNADAAATFGGSDLGTFAASDALTLNGGELNSYKNGSSNVCGGNVYYRVYASGATPGSFSSVALPYDSELANPGDQKWDETAAGIDLLAGLTAGGAYTLEVYWDLAGADSDPAGCGETKFDSNFGNNFTASFTFNVPGCTDPNYAEYDANANSDDGSCATLMAVTNENTSATYATIQAAIDAATAGDVLTLAAEAFNPTGTVTVNKPLTINGAGSGSTTIYGGGTGYAIAVIADNVHLEGFTLNGAGSYGIKISNSTASVVQNFSMTDVATDGTTRTGIDLNGVDGATLTNIAGHNTTSGFGLAIASSANVTINGLTTSGNAWGDAAVYPAATEYQIAGFEAPTNITFAGDIDLSSGQGALSVQNGALASGGTWEGTVGFVAGETDIVTPASTMNTLIRATRSDGLTFQIVGKGEALEFLYGQLQSATSPFSYTDIAFLEIGNRNWVVFGSLDIQTAIDAAMDGDQVELLSGPYAPSATINVDKSITLMGQGSGSTTIDVGGYNAWGIYITANDVTLSGVTIQGDAAVNEQYALKAGSGNNTGGTPSICENLTYSDIVIQGTKRTAIDLNGVDGATLTDITATGATSGFGMSISSSANVTVTNLTTSGNAWGDVGIFPANSPYQWPTLEGPTGITFDGTLDLSLGTGSISVQDGSLQSGGTWTGTISNDPSDGADVTVPAAFSHVVNSTRDADGLVLHNVGPQAAIHALAPILAANGFSGTTIDDLDNGDIEVVEGLSIQDAIDAASAGDVIEILDGSYAIATPILVNKAVTLQGQSEAGTVLTCEAALGGANSIQVTAGATLKDFTLEANSNATFGIHVQPGTDGAALSGLTINNTGSNGIGLSGVTNATVSDIAGSGNVQYILGIAGSVGVSASDISGGNVGVYKGTGTYAQTATDIAFTGTFNLAGGFVIEQLAGADEITYSINGDAADVQIPSSFDRVFFANYTSLPLPPPYNEASLATLVEAGNLATAIGTAQALDAYGYGLEDAAVYNLTADQWEVSPGLTIGDAIDRAEAGDLIDVAAGTYEEDLAFDKGLTINGPNAGIAHDGSRSAEAILDGEHTLSAAAAVTLDGLQFLSNNSAQTSTIYATTAAGHAIQNNLFVSSIAGGNTGGTHDLGIYTSVLASGSMTIAGNSFSGDGSFTDGDRYSSAAWGRGIWLNGGGASVTISGNAFTNCRTGMTLESYANDACSVDGNDFTDCGTGISMSNPATAAVTTITANRFQDVDTDLNLRNLTQAVTWNLATSDNLAIPGNSTFYSDLGYIPGNSAGDIDDPNGNLAFLSGNGADKLTFGADDNTVTGDHTGAGNDYIDGGDGTDRVNYSDNETDVTLTAGDGFVIMDSPNGGLDTLVNIEYLVLADATISLIGCTFPDACNFNDDALIDDGSCEFTTCAGCRDEDACNYDSEATLDGPIGTCTYPGLYEDCAGNCVNDANSNNICDELEAIGVEGCTDATATNYNPDATEDDGSCYTYTLAGCLIPSATNYDPTVNVQGEPISAYCIFPWNAAFILPSTDCADPSACNYDAAASGYTECDYCLGCTDEGACNYDDTALYDNGSCTYTGCSGCTSDCSSNYDATAVIDNGSCDYANCGGCTDSEADNYNPAVSIDDGSCQYEGCTLPSACNFDPDANANDGSCSLDPAPVISAVDLVLSTTSLSAADGEVSVTVDSGTPVSLDLEGLNGTTDASFSYPGTYNGLAAGYYAATVTDGFGCVSNSLNVVVSYDLCCDCGVSDIDSDGICDDEDNCTDKSAPNYADPAEDCRIFGCTDPAYVEYNAAANTDDGSCATLASTCASPTMDGHTYSVVEIGDQCWFAENLRTTVYADDSAIPEVTDDGAWSGLSTGARSDYNNDITNVATYGRLYNGYAVDDARGLCPSGWHVPTDGEWTDLENHLSTNGHSGTEGTALKATSGWNGGGNGTDDSGFSALPGGRRNAANGGFAGAGDFGYWWSSSLSGGLTWYRGLTRYNTVIGRYNADPRVGYSVRCLRDAD